MKYLLVLCGVVNFFVQGKVLPNVLSNALCRKSDPDYKKCSQKNMEKIFPTLLKGIPELNFPPLDPLEIPYLSINRTLSEGVSVYAVMKKIKARGLRNFRDTIVSANPHDVSAEGKFIVPWFHVEMDYDVTGQLLDVPLRSTGFFSGNFTDIEGIVKGNLKTVERNGVKYFEGDTLFIKTHIGGGKIKLVTHDPEMQLTSNFVSNFFNENNRLILDTVSPLIDATIQDTYKDVVDPVLALVPAEEWLPE